MNMQNDKILLFLAEKIEEIKDAIFYCHSNSPLKISNTIIHTSKVDECGNITFFINRPKQLISEFDREFPVDLNYFKKGKNFFINIYGKARIILDPEELSYQNNLTAEEINLALTTQVLIKVQILKVDFHDNDFENKNLFFKKIRSVFSSLFDTAGAASRSYDFSGSSVHNYGF